MSGRPPQRRVRLVRDRDATPDDFLRRVEGEGADWIAVPDASRRHWQGTAVPVIGAREYRTLPSGLIVPAQVAAGPQPIDLIQVFLTAEEVFGRRFGMPFVEEELLHVDRDRLLVRCARILGAYEKMQADRRQLDDGLVGNWFTEPTATRVREALRGDRRLMAPQGLLMLMRYALVVSPTEPPDDRLGRFPALLMALQDALGGHRDLADRPDSPVVFGGDTESTLFREMVQNQAFYASVDTGTMLARHHLHWNVLPERMHDDPRQEDLVRLFAEATGVPFDDFVAVGLALWAIVEMRDMYPVPREVLGLKLPQERLEAALNLLSRTAEEMREEILRRDAEFDAQWSFDTFRLFPVIRMDDGQLLVVSKDLLLQRMFTWLPIHDLRHGLEQQGPEGLRSGVRAYQWFRAIAEAEAMESLNNLMPSVGGVRRFYGEEQIQAAFGTQVKNADAVLDYGDAWVVLEVSTRHLTRESVAGGSAEALEKDLERGVVKKVGQIDSTIGQLIRDETLLTGHPAMARRRYVAVLVVTEGFPVNPMTMTAIHGRLAERRLLMDPRIGPLHILDQEDLNIVEAVIESGGPSLLQLLEDHESGNLRNMDFKSWLIVERRLEAGRPERIAGPYENAWRPVLAVAQEAMVQPDE